MEKIIRQPVGQLDTVSWIDLPSNLDSRGTLTSIESGKDIPFEVKRLYILHHVKSARGGHAHRDTHQVVTAVSGQCEIVLSDGKTSKSFMLDNPNRGLSFGPMLWIEMPLFSLEAVIVVIASTHYDKKRSIRTWEDYLDVIKWK